MKIFKDLIQALKDIKEAIQSIKDLNVIDSRFKDVVGWHNKILFNDSYGSFGSMPIDMMIDKDYFTKEFLSPEQTDRVDIYVIENDYMTKCVCRKTNLPKSKVVDNNWKKYYFV